MPSVLSRVPENPKEKTKGREGGVKEGGRASWWGDIRDTGPVTNTRREKRGRMERRDKKENVTKERMPRLKKEKE